MTRDQFKQWRQRMGWTQTEAARALDCTFRRVQQLEAGTREIKRETALACAWIERHGALEPAWPG